MKNIEKLKRIGIIGNIRQRYGASDENDPSKDEIINQLNNDQIMEAWSSWNLGYSGWWELMNSYFDKLEQMN